MGAEQSAYYPAERNKKVLKPSISPNALILYGYTSNGNPILGSSGIKLDNQNDSNIIDDNMPMENKFEKSPVFISSRKVLDPNGHSKTVLTLCPKPMGMLYLIFKIIHFKSHSKGQIIIWRTLLSGKRT